MGSNMARPSAERAVDVAQRLRASNRRVAWTLASVAAVFFAGIIATRWVNGGTVGIGVMGAVVLLFLVVAIGRNLWGGNELDSQGSRPKDPPAREPAGAVPADSSIASDGRSPMNAPNGPAR